MKTRLIDLACIAGTLAVAALIVLPHVLRAQQILAPPQPPLLVLRIYLTTNAYPGYFSGPSIHAPAIDSNGIVRHEFTGAVNLNAIWHPPSTNAATSYVLGFRTGTNETEVTTITK